MAPLGVLVGMASEAECLAGLGDAVRIACSGARPALARTRAAALADAGVSALVSFGIAGALKPGLVPGTLLLPTAVVLPDGAGVVQVTSAWHARVAARTANGERAVVTEGRVVGSDRAVISVGGKAALARASAALAVDMESHVVATLARARGLPFLVIRAVADPAERAIPAAALVGLAPDGTTRPWSVALRLLAEPWTLPALLQLARDSQAGLAGLAAAAAWLASSAAGPKAGG